MINALFNTMNFIVIVGVAWYLCKHYFAGMLKRSSVYDVLAFEGLRRQSEDLAKQKKHLALSLKHQQVEYQQLVEKIAHWREAVAQRQHAAQEEYERVVRIVSARRAQQAHDIQQAALYARVIPQAVQEAE